MRISDWSSDGCSTVLIPCGFPAVVAAAAIGVAVLAAVAMLRRLPTRLVLAAGLPYVVLGLASAAWLRNDPNGGAASTEERRGGKQFGMKCRSRGVQHHEKKKRIRKTDNRHTRR